MVAIGPSYIDESLCAWDFQLLPLSLYLCFDELRCRHLSHTIKHLFKLIPTTFGYIPKYVSFVCADECLIPMDECDNDTQLDVVRTTQGCEWSIP